jgi:hypothetical protein
MKYPKCGADGGRNHDLNQRSLYLRSLDLYG